MFSSCSGHLWKVSPLNMGCVALKLNTWYSDTFVIKTLFSNNVYLSLFNVCMMNKSWSGAAMKRYGMKHITWLIYHTAAYKRQWTGSTLVQIIACRPLGAKLLSKPMLGCCQLDKLQWHFNQNTKHFHEKKCISKQLLWNSGHFVQRRWAKDQIKTT